MRGWSQKYVADQIGTDAFTVNRWENGVTFPTPHYRQLLCQIFGKSVEELGLLPPPNAENSTPMRLLPANPVTSAFPFYDPTIPLPPPGIKSLVGRDELIHSLKGQLFCKHRPLRLALTGLPGVGKTALLVTLARDTEVQAHFQDGILWAGLGRDPNLFGVLSRWGKLLGISDAEMSKLSSLGEWTRAIHAAIGARRMLVVIDDVWRIEDALALEVGGVECTHLLTSRRIEVALQFAGNDTITVQELGEDCGVVLLARHAPAIVNAPLSEVRALVRSVGGLPLALTLVGRYLKTQAYGGQRRRMLQALDRLYSVEERLHLSMPVSATEGFSNLPDGTPISLQSVIDVSDQQLSETARHALYALSVFPARPASFSEAAALAVANVPAEVLDALTDSGLLESCGQDRYTLHQTIADYAKLRLSDQMAEQRAAEFFVTFAETHYDDYDALEAESDCILTALQLAYERSLHGYLVRGVCALAPYWEVRGQYALAEMHLSRAQEAALASGDDDGLARVWLHLGRIANGRGDLEQAEHLYRQGLIAARRVGRPETISAILLCWGEFLVHRGDYMQAEQYLWESMALARELGHRRKISLILQNLGEIADARGEYEQGSKFYAEGLKLVQQDGDYAMMSIYLQNMGVKAGLLGNYVQAWQLYEEGLQYARKIGHKQRISALLMNMGLLAFRMGQEQQALELSLESLELGRQVGHRMRIASVLQNLGIIARASGDYEQAAQYLEESLLIAREIKHNWLIAETLCEWGELHLAQTALEPALSVFEQALVIAEQIQGRELQGFALFGLARVASAQGNDSEALRLGQRSHALYASMEHERAGQIAQWLAALCR
jgi:tetratricopeptide (TPR) repeat protein/transcriptional regulator with XRE-family HTH domain